TTATVSFSGASRARSKLTAITASSDHFVAFQRLHLFVAQTEQLAVDVAVVLAQQRPPSAHEGRCAGQLDRIALVLELADLGVVARLLGLGSVPAGLPGVRAPRRDDPALLAPPHDVVAPARPDPAPDDGVELVLVRHARLVGHEARVHTQIGLTHHPAERFEL